MRGPLRWTEKFQNICDAVLHPPRSESRRGPLTLARSAHSTSPRTRGEVKQAIPFSQRDPRRSFINGEARIGKVRFAIHHSPLAFFFPQKKRGGGTPANADPYPPRTCECGNRAFMLTQRRLIFSTEGFHHGSHLRESSSSQSDKYASKLTIAPRDYLDDAVSRNGHVKCGRDYQAVNLAAMYRCGELQDGLCVVNDVSWSAL